MLSAKFTLSIKGKSFAVTDIKHIINYIINTDALMHKQHFTVVAARGGATFIYRLVQWLPI